MTSACLYDPLRNVWTRVAMIARLRFGWDVGAALGAAPSWVKYGYSLAFTDRDPAIHLRPLGADVASDPVAAKLAKAPKPFGGLIGGACFLAESAAPACDARQPGAKGDASGGASEPTTVASAVPEDPQP